MAKQEYSSYQKKVIQNYYQHKDTIVLTRLQELVTDLYLAEGKKRAGIWQRIATARTLRDLEAIEAAPVPAATAPRDQPV